MADSEKEPRGGDVRDSSSSSQHATTAVTTTAAEPTAAHHHHHEYVTGPKLFAILVPTTLVYFLVMLDGSIIATAIPAITTQFDSLLDIAWYGSAYQLASAAFQPLSGKIYTYFSTKWVFLAFFALFELGSVLCGAARSSAMLIVGRAVAGLGSSGLANGALTILAATLPPHRQPMVMGINVGLGQIGIACGPLIGGAFTEYVTWRWCFYINLPIGAVVAGLLLFVAIPEPEAKPPPVLVLRRAFGALDLVGFVLVAPATVMLCLALQYGGNQYAWNSSVVVGLLVGFAVTLAVFLAWERWRGDEAMVPFSLLRQPIIYSASSTMFFFLGVLFVANFYLPIYFQAVKDDSALMSGVHILPTIIGQVVFAMMSGVMIEVLGYYLPWVLSGTALTAVAYGLLSMLQIDTPVSRWVGFQILYGVGCGAAATSSYIAIQNLIPAAQIPIAMGILIFFQNIGGAVWLVVAQTIFTSTLRDDVARLLPNINPDVVIGAGARSLRLLFQGAELHAVLEAYNTSISRTMYLGVALSVVSFFFSWGLGWKDVRIEKKKVQVDGAVQSLQNV
ncbi:MFS general substrate transporter [Echria macrotheca]|uniref:MFS general substrate transporter n=1 Tax=Echria macrotheca TaxID=438768 RepID=A0AAJ0BMZ6_9PEZI|nr:MFS general substrate transporter [Echria macrotheca]